MYNAWSNQVKSFWVWLRHEHCLMISWKSFFHYSLFSAVLFIGHTTERKMVGVILWILCNVKSQFGRGKWIALAISLSARRQYNFLGWCNSLGVHTLWGVYDKWQIRSSSLLGAREMHGNKHEKTKGGTLALLLLELPWLEAETAAMAYGDYKLAHSFEGFKACAVCWMRN
jgi:hypothetical protein